MNVSTHTRESLRLWGPTGLAGTASAGLVTLLLTAVMSAPALSAPATGMPFEPAAPSTTGGTSERITVPCFMDRHSWADGLVGPPPRCSL